MVIKRNEGLQRGKKIIFQKKKLIKNKKFDFYIILSFFSE